MNIPKNFSDYKIVYLIDQSFQFSKLGGEFIQKISPDYVIGLEIENIPKLNEIQDIKSISNGFVILFSDEKNKAAIGKYVKLLDDTDAEYCFYKLLQDNYSINSDTLFALNDKSFADANGNKIELSENVKGNISFNFNKSKNGKIFIGKNFYANKLEIFFSGMNTEIFIENNVIFHSGNISICDCGKIEIGANSSLQDNLTIQCKSDYTLISKERLSLTAQKPQIKIGRHVKICDNSVILAGANIGNGSIIAPFTVVDSDLPICCEASGNRAVVVRENVSWAYDQIPFEKPKESYDLTDRAAFKFFDRKSVFVHGSCVSRTTIEYSAELSVKYHLLQNPIHTMFYKGIKISPDAIQVQNNSAFLRKTLATEFSKDQIACIKNNVADFFLMDIADIRWSYFEFVNNPDVRLYAHFDIYNTLLNLKNQSEENKKIFEFEKKEYSTVSLESWKKYIDKYVDLILNYYSKRQIIFIKVPIAKGYYDHGEYVKYSDDILEIKFEPLLRELENYIITEKINGAKIIEIDEEIYGNSDNTLGNMPLHYTDNIYKKMVKEIDEYVKGM